MDSSGIIRLHRGFCIAINADPVFSISPVSCHCKDGGQRTKASLSQYFLGRAFLQNCCSSSRVRYPTTVLGVISKAGILKCIFVASHESPKNSVHEIAE